jgi:hypothetical protein
MLEGDKLMKKEAKELRLKQISGEKFTAYCFLIASICFSLTIIGLIIGLPLFIYSRNKINKLKIEEIELR